MADVEVAVAKVVAEVIDLHVFFVQWFTDVGPWEDETAANAAFDVFLGRFADSFEKILICHLKFAMKMGST